MEQRNKKIIVGIVALVVAAAVMFGIYQYTRPETAEGEKNITVTVVHGDASEKVFEYNTDEEYLAPVITSDGLAEGDDGEYGLFIKTVDGETADDTKEEWWCITQDGEPAQTSASELVIEDGDKFELTLTVGY